MGFLIPYALAFSALAIPIIIFYMLKLRRRPARVSSLFLWQQVLEDRQANAPWQRLKRNLLLLLQLLILALLVMALARPYFTVETNIQGNIVLLLDASASMQATDVSPTRFAAAQEAAVRLIDRLDPGAVVTLIAVEYIPRVLAAATTDRNQLKQVLTAARPSNGSADWPAALALAAANAAALPEATIVIIGDGASGQSLWPESTPPGLTIPIEFIPVGQQANNQGLVALSLRDGSKGLELFLRVVNAAPESSRRRLEIYVDDQLFDVRQIEIPAHGSLGVSLSDLPLAARRIQAVLAGHDDLPLDDAAWLARSGAPAQVLLVSEGNLFLERALALLPHLNVRRAPPDQALPQARFDLVIFDRTLPALPDGTPLPESNLLFLAPPTSTLLFVVTGALNRPQVTRIERHHPLLTYVELNTLNIAQAQAITPPPWAQTLIEAKDGPLLLAGQQAGRRIAILAFDLHQSDLPLQIDFPILVLNLTRWLLPGESLEQVQTIQAGQDFTLPIRPLSNTLQIKTPTGDRLTLLPGQNIFSHTADLGIYQLFAGDVDQPSNQAEPILLTEFAVNLLAEEETDIQPRQIQTIQNPSDLPSVAGPAKPTQAGRLEWGWLLVGLGLVVLLVEWWVYWQGEAPLRPPGEGWGEGRKSRSLNQEVR